ncbi:MarR family winged helix-turn-helix transcriptional regulator [Streptomyces sp. NPDC006422]|uniref:MarR family winged helix-turn-helix transcriptional regulator n=1 Tax=unclassified Streptomyces TaxID=2593676 RepID=UPI0033BDFBF0
MDITEADQAAASELSHLLGPLRRAVLRATRNAADLPDLPEAQIELLRVLADGPLPARETADRLRVAPSTVSNLVKSMRAAGLVERRSRPDDARTVLLAATAKATDLLDRYDHASAAALARGIEHLTPQERTALRAALPALSRLAAGLTEK